MPRLAQNVVFKGKTTELVPPRGNELSGFRSMKTTSDSPSDVRSDVVTQKTTESPLPASSDPLAEIVARLGTLSPETLAALQALFGGQPPPT